MILLTTRILEPQVSSNCPKTLYIQLLVIHIIIDMSVVKVFVSQLTVRRKLLGVA